MNAELLEISFFCFVFNVTRLSLCKSGENVSRQCTFFAHETRGKQILSTKLCPPEQVNTDEQRSHSAVVDDRTF